MLIECMSKRNFQFRRLRPILRSTGPAEHTRTPPQRLEQCLNPLRRVTVPRAGSKGASMKFTKDSRQGYSRLADRRHRSGARSDQRSGFDRRDREGPSSRLTAA
jgi:hypothetical protein